MLQNIYLILILIYIFPILLKSENDFVQVKLNINIEYNEDIKFKSVEEDEIIKGTLKGKIESIDDKNFNKTRLECDFIGRSYKGRGFSCGFAVIEDLQGFCYIYNNKKKGTLITSWNCNTSPVVNGEPSCSGKLNLVHGFGIFAGVTGYGKINMPLAKSLNKKNSTAMQFNLKVKYPMSLKKNSL